ncbi:RNA polymerase sigma factor [Kitasatospora sp. NPDC048239]|uniref:RNA polymerase sigma factor n=1 Tax=Kitasatospora sp. NPDC048239 TaxID=3364046 RepID=UPI003718FC45
MSQRSQAVADLVAAKGGELKRFAYLLCRDDAHADDLVQDAIVKVLARRPVADIDNIERYVKRAIVTGSIDGFRKAGVWRRFAPVMLDRHGEPDVAEGIVVQDTVHAAVRTLAPRQRACVVLHYYDDMPVAAIAEVLNCSAGTVKRHLSDARSHLVALLEHQPESGS